MILSVSVMAVNFRIGANVSHILAVVWNLALGAQIMLSIATKNMLFLNAFSALSSGVSFCCVGSSGIRFLFRFSVL